MKIRNFSLRSYIIVLTVLAMLLGTAACGENVTPTTEPVTTPTEVAVVPTAITDSESTTVPAAMFIETDCPFEVPVDAVVECGFVVVPEDHDDPVGPTVRIAVAVIKDQSEDHLTDPVMLLSGGPGEKTVLNTPAMVQRLAPIHPNRDLIIFDHRGVGLCEPALECPEFVQAFFDLLDESDPDVALQARFGAVMACRDRLVSEGHNLSAYNTTQNAADVNSIRIALGYDQVNLYGGSYG